MRLGRRVDRLADPTPLPTEVDPNGNVWGGPFLTDLVKPAPGHPTVVISITAADGRALGDLQLTVPIDTARELVDNLFSDIVHREE